MPFEATPMARRVFLSWAQSEGLTPQRLWPVLRAFGGLEAMLSASEGELSEALQSKERARAVLFAASDREADRLSAGAERLGFSVVTAFEEEYPPLLREIADPPFLLYAAGNLERLKLPAVAVVGSRDATRYGRDVGGRLARELSLAGVTVVSGFARGVDAEAHAAARGGDGGTIAVWGAA